MKMLYDLTLDFESDDDRRKFLTAIHILSPDPIWLSAVLDEHPDPYDGE